MDIKKIIQAKSGTIVDVRTPEEFRGGHVAGSVNISLHELPRRVEELKTLQTPLVLCCASGSRSSRANRYLREHQIECCDGGSWMDVNDLLSQTE
jgi:phage shock protein E